ncbi:MAG TPA: hypothetical protein VG819_00600 [Rhizomicrobium sp.]|jgi:hypothetical protein|nr:hypothetical protein [Rhizomicrobium sp.]
MLRPFWLAGALALVVSSAATGAPYYPANGADFLVPVDELDAVAVGEAANRAGFYPVPETDPNLKALRTASDPVYEIWRLPSGKVAKITLTRMSKTNRFALEFVALDPSRHNDPLSGEACRKWLAFSNALRSEFRNNLTKFRFRRPQCTP